MTECPFLSTYEGDVECFKECALFNYKETGGICPFKKISNFRTSPMEDRIGDIEAYQGELDYIRKSYFEASKHYL